MTTLRATDTCARCKRTVDLDHPDHQWWEQLEDGSGAICEDCVYRSEPATADRSTPTPGERYDALIGRLREALSPEQFALVLELDSAVGDRLHSEHAAGDASTDDDDGRRREGLEVRVERIEEVIAQLGDVAASFGRRIPA